MTNSIIAKIQSYLTSDNSANTSNKNTSNANSDIPVLSTGWDPKIDVYTPKSPKSSFTNDLTNKMDYKTTVIKGGIFGWYGPGGILERDEEQKKVRSLAEANIQIGKSKKPDVFNETEPANHSPNLHPNGWVADPKRTSTAILIKGQDDGNKYYENSRNKMKDKLVQDYGLKYDPDHPENSNIIYLDNPTEDQIKTAMNNAQGGDNSQVMLYYTGRGNSDQLATTNDAPLSKVSLQADVNGILGPKCPNISVVIDSGYNTRSFLS